MKYYGVEINAITLGVADMKRSVQFYGEVLGLPIVYGGAKEPFTSLEFGSNFVNLFIHDGPIEFWGRVIFHVADPDAMYATLVAAGVRPEAEPADAPWGERYFHVRDPDGHELSIARKL